jgi:hypothetical protein
MANNSLTIYTNRFFALVLKSPFQRGSLSIINSVTNISRLGTFKLYFVIVYCKKLDETSHISSIYSRKISRKISQIQLRLQATEHNCRSAKKYYLLSTDHSKTTLPCNHPFCDILTIPSCTLQQNTGTFYLRRNFLSNCRQGHYSTSKY